MSDFRFPMVVVLALMLIPMVAAAQFDSGRSSSRPWDTFDLPNTKMKLDFRNSNVDMVISLFSTTSGITIVKDPSLTGQITVTSASSVPLSEAFQILNTTLGMRGYDMTREGNLLVIRQRNQRNNDRGMDSMSAEMLQGLFGGGGDSSVLRVYRLTHANATSVARTLNEVFAQQQQTQMQQLAQMFGRQRGGRGGGNFNQNIAQRVRASADDYSNSVIVNAPTRDHEQVRFIISQIDTETEQPLKARVFSLAFAPADTLVPILQNVLISNAPRGRGGAGGQQVPIEQRFQQAFRLGSAQAAFGSVIADTRTNAVIVTATEENLELIASVITELDTEVVYENSTFVFPLTNARADQMASLLGQAFGTRVPPGSTGFGRTGTTQQRQGQQQRPGQQRPGGGMGGGGGFRPGGFESEDGSELELYLENPDMTLGELYTMIEVQQGGGFGRALGSQTPGQAGVQGRDAQGRIVNVRDLSGQITVIPDPNTNSLIVVTSPDNVDLIRGVLDQLDRIPEQVMIETLIVEATLDRSTQFGVEWAFANTGGNVSGQGSQGFGLQSATPALQGFRYALTSGDVRAFLHALQTDQKFQVLSTPRIFTSNNVQAQINISQRVPYVLSTREDALGNLTFNYAFQDVGIVLTVTPRITANGMVTMDVLQTANDLQGFTAFNAPIINQRQAETTVSVRDGETIILGGIIRSTVTSTTKKIPLLGDIPILGQLFRSTSKADVKTELLVFLTPRIVRDPDEAQRLREEQQNQLSPPTQGAINRAAPPRTDPPTNSGGNR